MSQYFVLTDAINNSVYGLVVKSENSERAYGADARSSEWAKWFNTKSEPSIDEHLPIGVIKSAPKNLKSSEDGFVEGLLHLISGGAVSSKTMEYLESELTGAESSTPRAREYMLGAFDIDQRQDAINFKALAFIYDSKANAYQYLLRNSLTAFDRSTGLIKSRIPGITSLELQEKVDSSIPKIAQRRIGLETSFFKENVAFATTEEKRIGGRIGSRIGRGLRSAPPGLVFVDITGAIDADTDGIVFEGKPGLERPIIPRFTLPEALGRQISNAIRGDAEENEKLRRSGRLDANASAAKIRELLGGDSSRISEVDATQAMARPLTSPSRLSARNAIMQRRTGTDRLSRIGRGGKTQLDTGQSRAIDRMSWDDDKKELIVTFASSGKGAKGRTYTYSDVDDKWIKEFESNPDALGRLFSDFKKAGYKYSEGGDHALTRGRNDRARRLAGMRSSRGYDFDNPMDYMWAEEEELRQKILRDQLENIDDYRNDLAGDLFRDSKEYSDLLSVWEKSGAEGDFEESEEFLSSFEAFLEDNRDEIDQTIMAMYRNPGKPSSSRSTRTQLSEAEVDEIRNAPLYDLARLIRKDIRSQGGRVPFGAEPYLDALSSLDSVDDNYGLDSGRSIVSYLLGNLSQYRGEYAKAVKSELRTRLKAKPTSSRSGRATSETLARASRDISLSSDDVTALLDKHFGEEFMMSLDDQPMDENIAIVASALADFRSELISSMLRPEDGQPKMVAMSDIENAMKQVWLFRTSRLLLGNVTDDETNTDEVVETSNRVADMIRDYERELKSTIRRANDLLGRWGDENFGEPEMVAARNAGRAMAGEGDSPLTTNRELLAAGILNAAGYSGHEALPRIEFSRAVIPGETSKVFAIGDDPRLDKDGNEITSSIFSPQIGTLSRWADLFPEAEHDIAIASYRLQAKEDIEDALDAIERGEALVLRDVTRPERGTIEITPESMSKIRKDTMAALDALNEQIDAFQDGTSDDGGLPAIRKTYRGRQQRAVFEANSLRSRRSLGDDDVRTVASVRTSSRYSGQSISGGTMPTWDELQKMNKVVGPLGSNGGQWYEDLTTGKKFFVKPTPSPAHAYNESAVAAVYRAAGTPAPNIVTVTDPSGRTHIISEAIPGLKSTSRLSDTQRSDVKIDMGIDMLLSNWDVFGGGDNTKMGPTGAMYRVDTGGGGMFRARGGAKPSFGPDSPWVEPATMIYSRGGQAQNLYGRVSNADFSIAMAKVANLDLDTIEKEMIDAGIPKDVRQHFMATIAVRQKLAKDYAELFSQFDPDARVNVTDTSIAPGGNKLPSKSPLKRLFGNRSLRSNGGRPQKSSNPLMSPASRAEELLPEEYNGTPSKWGSVAILPNTLSLLKEKRQMQFNSLVDDGMSPQEAAELVTEAHVSSNMRLSLGRALTTANAAAYSEYATAYDSMLGGLDGWPSGSMADSEMRTMRQMNGLTPFLDDFFSSLSPASSRSVRWSGPGKSRAPKLRDDIDGVVVSKGREGSGIQFEIIERNDGRFIISGIERDENGAAREIGYGIIDSDTDFEINSDYDTAELALEAANGYVDGPDFDFADELDDGVDVSSRSRRNTEILFNRASTLNDDGTMARPARGFHYADMERMHDRQLFEEYRSAIGRAKSGDNAIAEIMAAQKALEDRRLLIKANDSLSGRFVPEFDRTGAITNADTVRKSLASSRSSRPDGMFEANMTLRQLGSLESDMAKVRQLLEGDSLKYDRDTKAEIMASFDEMSEAVLDAVLAVDAIIVPLNVVEDMSEISTRIQGLSERAKAGDLDLPLDSGVLRFADFIKTLEASPDGRFVTGELDARGTMHDLPFDRESSRLGRLLNAARTARRKSGRDVGPSYIESRSRRSRDARNESIIRDAFIDSQEFDNYFEVFRRTTNTRAERRARGINNNRELTVEDYLNSPEFREDMRRWNADKSYEAISRDLPEIDDLSPSEVASALARSDSGASMESGAFSNFVASPSGTSSQSRRLASYEDFLGSAEARSILSAGGTDGSLSASSGSPTRSARSGIRTSSVQERRRIATIETSSSLRSKRSSVKPGFEKILDTDGEIWGALKDSDKTVVAGRLGEMEDALIRAISGGSQVELKVSYGTDGSILNIDAVELTPIRDEKVVSVLGGRGNESVALYDLTPDFALWGSAIELERAPRNEKEKARQAKINKYPLLTSVRTVDANGNERTHLALNEKGLANLDRTYLAMRGELTRMLDSVDDSKPAGRERRKKILKAIRDLDENITALKTIASARLGSRETGKNKDGLHPFEYVLEQLPVAHRTEVLGQNGELMGTVKPKLNAFNAWVKKTQTQQNGKKVARGSKAYKELLKKYEAGELDDTLFEWWRGLSRSQLDKLGLRPPSDYFDEDNNPIPSFDVKIDLPDGIDIDAPHSGIEAGNIVPGISDKEIERSSRKGGFWRTALFQLTRPNNEAWLERQAKADARRLKNIQTGKAGYGGIRDEIERTRKEKKRLKRNKAERLKGLKADKRSTDEINALRAEKAQKKIELVSVSDNGDVSVSERGLETLATARVLKVARVAEIAQGDAETPEEKKAREKAEKAIKSRNKKQNLALAHFWEKAEYNEQPTVVTEEEFYELAKQDGAIVIRRGFGGRTYANEYLDDPNRFTTGQGYEAQGPGEYWAVRVESGVDVRGQSSGWDSWVTKDAQGNKPDTEPGPGAVMAILSPDAKIITKRDLGRISKDLSSVTRSLERTIKDPIFPSNLANKTTGKVGAELLEMMDQRLFDSIPKGDPLWDTTAGKLILGLIAQAKAAPNDAERKKILDALVFLTMGVKGDMDNLLAVIFGFDAIRADSGVMLVMNRGALVTFGGVGGMSMTRAVEAGILNGTMMPDEMAKKLQSGARVD